MKLGVGRSRLVARASTRSSSFRMSTNSAESKTSPHVWHSTNSTSSSRATTRTWGCLHGAGIGRKSYRLEEVCLCPGLSIGEMADLASSAAKAVHY